MRACVCSRGRRARSLSGWVCLVHLPSHFSARPFLHWPSTVLRRSPKGVRVWLLFRRRLRLLRGLWRAYLIPRHFGTRWGGSGIHRVHSQLLCTHGPARPSTPTGRPASASGRAGGGPSRGVRRPSLLPFRKRAPFRPKLISGCMPRAAGVLRFVSKLT